ncbi:MAG: hypothetical protein ABI898_09790 [Sphingomonadales bacterium]
MIKTFIAFTVLAAAAQPALAETFTRDGTTYSYTVAQRGTTSVISGRNMDTREPFILRVSGTRVSGTVSGTVSGRPVSFSTREVVTSKASTEIAAR